MPKIKETDNFKGIKSKLDKSDLIRLEKLLVKIFNNPEIGKPMKYDRIGTREVYMKPFRLSYNYDRKENTIFLLEIYHKKKQ